MQDNDEVEARLAALEKKVDILIATMERALGAWVFIKIMASLSVGLAIISTAVHDFFSH